MRNEDVSEQCLQSKDKHQCQTLTTTIKNIFGLFRQ
jgi:hypothetical protein